MKAQEIRDRFVSFFEKYEHKKIPSSSLIPYNDPTLLFTNAGMNQFKDYFTGKEKPDSKRAVTIQKCVRAGGKHNDLESVGRTARHHTFFEMLGNFSFGDYFKSEAISFAWKFLTEDLKIPKEKLYITVHDSDDEAEEIWIREQGVPKERIFRMGDKDNFWEMGETGPCGPCSEIFYDHGEQYTSGKFDNPLLDEKRYVEIWNLVFMQFEKHAGGKRTNLPAPSVDTGAGLERLSAVMQGVYWNYDTDLFTAIISEIEKISKKKYSDPKNKVSIQVIADHIRSATMLITDGAIPSNEGRGYVLRRIIRRAIRHLNELGVKETVFYKLVPIVFTVLGKEYPENQANRELAEKTLKLEEEKFRTTLENGLKVLNKFIDEAKGKVLPGDLAFKLYDTYGFPLDLTDTILEEHSMTADHSGFEKCMQTQIEQSKSFQKFQPSNQHLETLFKVKEKFGATKFLGYDNLEATGKLLAVEVLGDQYGLIFDQTPFYGESGGQVGDRGLIDASIKVTDTQKPVEDLFVHLVSDPGHLEIGKSYSLSVDGGLRSQTMKNHSATHLMQAALIEVLGNHVKQAGSLVNEEKLRFDFTHDHALTTEQIEKIEDLVNDAIQNSLPVTSTIMKKDEAIAKGAMALFGEKYGEEVRVITMGEFSTELCGGTHVKDTQSIGLFKILSESSLSTGVRRIEATTHETARKYLIHRSQILKEVERQLKIKPEKIENKIEALFQEIKDKNKEIEQLQDKIRSQESKNLFEKPIEITNGHNLYITNTKQDVKDLRKIADLFVDKHPTDILFLHSQSQNNYSFVLKTNKKNKNVNLSKVIKNIWGHIDGKGGGKPDMIQGSIPTQALDSFKDLLVKELKSL
ncbi:MAG: alanine--tRNA ligase [Halobacteriovoraceae bacterium]|nr:alanine--tRNA ligase [Halobacteriovoraceae bacterium]